MIVGIDHILIAVQDVDGAMEFYRRLGFRVSRGGDHPRMGTCNALIALADGCYFELIGVKNRERAMQFSHTRNVLNALARDNRLAAFALDSTDIKADVQAIRERGLAIGDPAPGERVRLDSQHVEWLTAHCDDELLPFLIQDATARSLRIAPPEDGIGQFLRVAALSVNVHDLKAGWSKFANFLGMMSTANFELARGAIRLQAAATDELARVRLVADKSSQVLDHWRSRDVPFQVNQMGGRVVLTPLETLGVAIDFVL